MTPPSDKVRSLTPPWSKLAYEAPPAFGVGGRVGPCLEDWAREGSCVDQCEDEVWHGDELPAQVSPTYPLGQHPHGGFAHPQEGSLRTTRPASHPCGDGAPL